MRAWKARLAATSRLGMRLNCWKTRPTARRRSSARRGVAEAGDLGAGDGDAAGVDGVEAGDEVQERALAAARLAGERQAAAGGEGERDAGEDRHRALRAGVGLRDVDDVQHRSPAAAPASSTRRAGAQAATNGRRRMLRTPPPELI